ncbi:M61 family metallopeptidase [Salmonirosea aquatica]|uniref:PDZ domain-containing protein n=1 Tax=Salmonirosea aquatica TaxID=2654236 RepID=A0A7C9BQK6_9BACT|nr:PDZ domain-containing protein [Cytophagaceae bacterium SJW1-29]
MKYFIGLICLFAPAYAQTHHDYQIAFPNAVHHEAEVSATFKGLEDKVLELRMSRTSPGRYAIHEFAKNVYNVKATDENGQVLSVTRPNPYQWNVSGHHGTVKLSYTLFANRGDGTYSQVDETHAHLNIPATFMYPPQYPNRPIRVHVKVRDDLNWKVATQLKDLGNNTYLAPDLDYFMDSPTEISNFQIREFIETSNGKPYTIRFALHHTGTEAELDTYMESVKKIVRQEKAVYGELPDYDFGQYTFLACYLGHVSGDGMEHRNSTVLTSTRSLEAGGLKGNAGTISHEFFHCWNVERIRPKSLQPFDYTEANMSGELWFAEGFTQYYTSLILCRAGLITPQEYVEGLAGSLNYVWNSPAHKYFTPIEMSYQAPFVDAATSLDPVNRENTFISYYTYGSVLGLALDLSLRKLDKGLSLDGFMQAVWLAYGRGEVPYTVRDLELALSSYAGENFAQDFFGSYIFKSQMPDYQKLLADFGVNLNKANPKTASLGAYLVIRDGAALVASNPIEGGAAYLAGLAQGDRILSLGYKPVGNDTDTQKLLAEFKVGETVEVIFERFGKKQKSAVTFQSDPSYSTTLKTEVPAKAQKMQQEWLGGK